jgi:arylsulfatase A-like enzyme
MKSCVLQGEEMNATKKNVLFVMCDQLRWDYLSCYGHPTLQTPNIDRLARLGTRFTNAFVQGPVCGPSRMSYYTGRYVVSHGSVWNFVPLRISELGLGDYLRPHGIQVSLVGKTHMEPDRAALRRLGVDLASTEGKFLAECGFEPYVRDDGIWPPGFVDEKNEYAAYLRQHGYGGDNPWHDWANSAVGVNGEVLSGWKMRYAGLPARVPEEHSETAYMTCRAMEFMEQAGDRPWVLHLSYIKPHWPYVAPAPYNSMYGPQDVLPVKQSQREIDVAHPVLQGYRNCEPSRNFSKQEVREVVIPTYMGLVKQIDDWLGRLFDWMEAKGLFKNTLIVFTSDHGDYLGDHFLGEKELFHDTVAKVPLIIYDPDPNALRGAVEEALVEAIDIVPTILDAYGLPIPNHILEGRSLLPLLRGTRPEKWRDAVFSENDFAFRDFVREPIGQPVDRCHMTMVRDHEWKYIHFEDMRPQLFDLKNDPDEFNDLGADPAYGVIRERMQNMLFDWLRQRRIHPTVSHASMAAWTRKEEKAGIHIGMW